MERSLARTLVILVGSISAAILLGAVLAVILVDWAQSDLGVRKILLEKGEGKLARRCMMLTGLLVAPLAVWLLGSFRKEDHGWRVWDGYTVNKPWWHFLITGFCFGMLTLGSLAFLAIIFGSRDIQVSYSGWKLARKTVEYLLKALVVGVLEETLVRGFLLRALSRNMGIWWAIFASSVFFAVLHFFQPADASFYAEGGVFTRAMSVAHSGFIDGFGEERVVLIKMMSLMAMSAFLCLVTLRTGSIWLAAGVHMGWVWVKLLNGVLSDDAVKNGLSGIGGWLFGGESAHTDGLVTVVLLATLSYFVGIGLWQAMKRGRGER